jgi:putative methyltransferase (TIGR04325 family)
MPIRHRWRSPRTAPPVGRASAAALRWLPPALADALRRRTSEWSYVGRTWPAADGAAEGWNDASVATSQQRHWQVLSRNVAGTGPLGVSHLPTRVARDDPGDHNTMMAHGYVLARAAAGRRRLTVLDWGGGVAHYHLYSRALLPEVELDYHCHDLPRLCHLGRTLRPEVIFHESPATALGRRYDLILCSSALHYFADWRATLAGLAGVADGFVYVARLSTVERAPSFVVEQRPHSFGYLTRYPSWCLNRAELLECAARLDLELLRELVFAEAWFVRGAPEDPRSRGFLFRRRQAPSG